MAFYGSSKVTLDSKGRFAVPTRYRPLITDGGGSNKLFFTRGRKKELWLLPEANWLVLLAAVQALPNADAFRRRIELNAEAVEMDHNGRLLVPSGLREKGLLRNPTLAFLGADKHFEIWDWDDHLRAEEDEQPAVDATSATFHY